MFALKARQARFGSDAVDGAQDTEVLTPVARVGAELRAARERLGWDLPDIAAGLRIRRVHLAALEDGDLRELPAQCYALGYLRSYSALLGLDADAMAQRYREATNDNERKPELIFPAPVPERGVPAGAVVLLGVLLAIAGYVGWYRLSGDGSPRIEQVATVPERLAVLSRPAPASETPAPRAEMPSVASAASPGQAEAFLMPSVSPSQAAAAVPVQPLTAVPPPVAAQPVVLASATPLAAPATPAAATPLPADADGRIVLRAHADTWVQVRDKQGQVILNRVLRSGESWNVPGRQQLLLTTGNAGGMDVMVDGLATPSLGASGAVRRDLPLDADMIKAGKLGVQVTAQQVPAQPTLGQAAAAAAPASTSPVKTQ